MANPSVTVSIPMKPTRRTLSLPAWLVLICVITFTVLLGAGAVIWKNAPPVPTYWRSPAQEVILSASEIQAGQETYLARGGQHIGSVWGHGSYLAPDWTADFLHRWGLATAGVLENGNPQFSQADLEALPAPERASLQAQVSDRFKTNRYDPQTQELTLTNAQTQGLQQVFKDYHQLLAHGSRIHSIPDGWFKDDTQIRNVTAFFAWTAWSAAANRPNAPFSYTANWPHDDLIGNQPPGQFVVWSIVSVIVLIGAIALFLFVYLTQEDDSSIEEVTTRPVIPTPTLSQKVTSLFFGANWYGYGDSPLCSGRKCILRYSLEPVFALCCFSDLASPVSSILDCNLLVSSRTIFCPSFWQTRTEKSRNGISRLSFRSSAFNFNWF